MRVLKSLLAVLTARWFWTLIGCVLLAALIWLFGDLLAFGDARPLSTDTAKLVAILVVALLWGISNLWAQARARRRNSGLVTELAAPAKAADPADAEIGELGRRFTGALDQLKKRRLGGKGGRRWLYQLPWYVMIGPPGSGKTTALVQSGLRFPLGSGAELRGVGGTRYCDWFFTDEAVLIDTAGRYTTQDSDRAGDAKAWTGFLELLARHRKRQPLNGVLVALSVPDLLGQGRQQTDHAAAVRARLAEIETSLKVRLPVYLLLTKVDLVAGFSEFMGEMGEEERSQVWGTTLPHTPGHDGGLDRQGLTAGLDDLVATLDRLLPQRLAAEHDPERRARLFGFPAQIAALAPAVGRFVDAAFTGSSYEGRPLLRGAYLTSGTQAGTPVDRLVGAIARSLGLPEEPIPASPGDRSFFLTRLLRDVVFGEASLVGRDLAAERRARLLRGAAIAGIALAVAGSLAAWMVSYVANRDRQLAVEASLAGWARDHIRVAKQRLLPTDADLDPVSPALGRLGELEAQLVGDEGLRYRFGLSQAATATAQLDTAYHDAVRDILLPRLTLRLEGQIRGRIDDADFLLEALKVYLMLGGRAPADADLVLAWFAADLRESEPLLAEPMLPHLAALAEDLPGIEEKPQLDGDVLAAARETLSRVPLAKRAYVALLASPEVQGLPGWRVSEHAGPNASATLVRRSALPLDAPVPGIFTYDAFHGVLLPVLGDAAKAAFAENWVLGQSQRPEPNAIELARLEGDMLKLYEDDAIAAWNGVLRDVTLAPLGSLDQAVERTKALSGPNSPLKLLVQSIVTETALTVPPPAEGEEGGVGINTKAATKAATQALGKLGSKLNKLKKLLKTSPGAEDAAPARPPGASVEAHFAYLKALVEGERGAPPALDEAITALGVLHGRLADAALAPNPAAAFAAMGATGAAQLGQAAARLPPPLDQMLGGVAQKATAISAGGIRQQLNAVWQADVLPICRTALGGRFPFARASGVDANLADVETLFAPGGQIDGFVRDRLTPFVDTARRPWRDLQGVGLAGGSLAQLERARRIGTSLFAGGGLKASFTLTPLALDAGAAAVTLDVDGQVIRYDHGPARTQAFAWPGPGGTGLVRLTFAPVGGGAPVTTVQEGTWSLFRLLQAASLQSAGQPDLFEVTLGSGSHAARFRLKAGSVDNPFDLALFTGFACPERL